MEKSVRISILGIVWGCERSHTYLYGTKFHLITDHKPLEVLYSKKSNPPPRIKRWVLRMQEFDYTVKYKPGSENIADALSRLICRDHKQERRIENVAEEYVRFVAQTATPKAMMTPSGGGRAFTSSVGDWNNKETVQYFP